jgi:hypothetical protein
MIRVHLPLVAPTSPWLRRRYVGLTVICDDATMGKWAATMGKWAADKRICVITESSGSRHSSATDLKIIFRGCAGMRGTLISLQVQQSASDALARPGVGGPVRWRGAWAAALARGSTADSALCLLCCRAAYSGPRSGQTCNAQPRSPNLHG